MSLRKSSRRRNGSKSDVAPKPNARRRRTPAPSTVGLAFTRRFTRLVDIGSPFCSWRDIAGARRPEAGDPNDDGRIPRAREVRLVRRLRVEAAGGQLLERVLVEARSIAEVPGARDDGRHAVVWMLVGFDAGVR